MLYLLTLVTLYLATLLATPLYFENRYCIVIDAGSTGTRAYVFMFQRQKNKKQIEVVKIEDCSSLPALTSFLKEQDPVKAASKTMDKLIEFPKNKIPAYAWGDTPIFLYATGGARGYLDTCAKKANEHERKSCTDKFYMLCKAMEEHFRSKNPTSPSIMCSALPIKDEAIFGWLGMSRDIFSIHPEEGGCGNSENDKQTSCNTAGVAGTLDISNFARVGSMGISMDMGGASTQIVYPVEIKNCSLEQSGTLKTTSPYIQESIVDRKFGSCDYKLFLGGYEGFGTFQGLSRIKEHFKNKAPSGELFPCIAPPEKLTNANNSAYDYKQINVEKCTKLIHETFFNDKDTIGLPSPMLGPDSGSPASPEKIVLFGGFSYDAKFFPSEPQEHFNLCELEMLANYSCQSVAIAPLIPFYQADTLAPARQAEIKNIIAGINDRTLASKCKVRDSLLTRLKSTDFKKAVASSKELCFRLCNDVVLLRDIYKVSEDADIIFAKNGKLSNEISWTLGVALNWTYSDWPEVFSPGSSVGSSAGAQLNNSSSDAPSLTSGNTIAYSSFFAFLLAICAF